MFSDNNEVEEIITPIDCTTRCIDVKWQNKLIIYTQEDVAKDSFRDPKTFYSVNGFGDYVYFKTIKRSTARKWSDEIFGKDKYEVRVVMKLSVR